MSISILLSFLRSEMKMSSTELIRLALFIFVIRVSATTDTATTPSQPWTLEDWTTEPEDITEVSRTSTSYTTTAVSTVSEDGIGQDRDTLASWVWNPIKWSWVLILQLLFAIIGIIGNFLVLLVLFQRRKYCRTTDTLIAALATADFLTSVFLIPVPRPEKIPDTWTGYAYCKIIYPNFPMWVCITSSIYTLMAIAIERFVAVVFPLYFSRTLTRRTVSIWVIIIWIASFLSGLRGIILFRVNKQTNRCIITYRNDTEKIAYGCFVFAIRIVIPTLTMLITQTVIAVTLHRQSTRFLNGSNDTNNQATFHVIAKNRILKLMLIVILIYVLCWSPNQIAFFGYNLGLVPTSYRYSSLNSIFTLLGFFNSCANPIIYTARHPEFRKAIKALFFSGTTKPHSLFSHGDAETSVTTMRKSEAQED